MADCQRHAGNISWHGYRYWGAECTWRHVSRSHHSSQTCEKCTWSCAGKCKPENRRKFSEIFLLDKEIFLSSPSDRCGPPGLSPQMRSLLYQRLETFHQKNGPSGTFDLEWMNRNQEFETNSCCCWKTARNILRNNIPTTFRMPKNSQKKYR